MHFDTDRRVFTYTFENETGMTPEAEIFVNAPYHYPEGFTVSCTDGSGAWTRTFDGETNILTVTADPAAETPTITLSPVE